MKTAYIFPGQGAQFVGMGKELFDNNTEAKQLFEQANEILGFNISDTMFSGTAEDLKETNVTQPAVFIHSIAAYVGAGSPTPDMVAGHSLGEFSALVACKVLTFEDALKLVAVRSQAMQKSCEDNPGTMAAILGMDDEKVEDICQHISNDSGEIVVAANYNCPGQLVISGSLGGVEMACGRLKEAGAKRALLLPVGGAFHSPLMGSAKQELAKAIEETIFQESICPIYQNVTAKSTTDSNIIKENLIAQLTGAVKWTQIIQHMHVDGATNFVECGPGKVLQGLVHKIVKEVSVSGYN